MNQTVLRIYMRAAAQRKGLTSIWQKIFAASLSIYLVKQAKEFGIEQAIFQRSIAGYLKSKNLVFDQSEFLPPDLPHCVELIDTDEKLRNFVNKYKGDLEECRVVLFKTAELLK